MQWEPSTVRPSVSVTVTVPPSRVDRGHPGLRQQVHPAPDEHVLEHGRGVGVLAGQHPVAARDQGDPAAEREVGTGELRTRDARADHDQVVGQIGEVVHLLPGEDPFAVGLRLGRDAWRGSGGQQYDVGSEPLLAVAGVHDHGVRPVEPTTPLDDRHALLLEPSRDVVTLVPGELLDARVDPGRGRR